MIRFGPAGWSYDDWAGIVYPSPKAKGFDPLAFLAGYFDTIEVNSTFYRPARESTARSWVRRVRDNPDFRFTAKLWRRFTHERREAWTREEVDAEPETEEVYVVTNNHYRGKAVANALMLRSMVARKKAPAPPPLFEEYRDVLEKYAKPVEA